MKNSVWQKIEEIFEKAVELPPTERDAYLIKVCNGDENLRQQIEKLLFADEQTNHFLDSPIFVSDSFAENIEDSVAPSFVGKKVGKYRLIKELGRGGMGAVFLAERDDSEFQKRVAVKLIKRGMDTDFILKRFRNERQILATLEHPNIAHLLDGGTTEDGLPFFVMEYVEGKTINKFCTEKKLSFSDRLQIFLQVCAAVEYAHQNSVIHRDLKPANIIVTNDGTPKLLDFGIAKILNPELAANTIEPTASMLRLMTPEFASPEQIKGETLTPATDIYSLGILLYELLTEKRPYKFPSRAPHEIARVICETEPLLPSEVKRQKAKGKKSDDQVSEDLDRIILKALRKKTSERYSSVADFAQDIQNYLSGNPVSADAPLETNVLQVGETGELEPATGKITSLNWLNRKAVLVTALLSILIGAIVVYFYQIGVISVYFYQTRNTSKPENIDSIAVLPFTNESGDLQMEYLSDGIAESLINSLSQLKGVKVIARSSVFRYKGQTIDPQTVGKEMNVRAVLTGKIIQRGDTLIISAELVDASDNRHLWGEKYDQKLKDLMVIQEDIARQMSRQLKATLTEEKLVANRFTENAEAYQAYLKGRYYWNKRTAEANKTAIDYFQQAVKLDPNFALAYVGMADCYIVAFGYQFMPSQEALTKAEEAVQQALKLNNNLGEAHASHAYIEGFGFAHYEEAGREFAKAVELNPNYATAHQWFSMYLAAMGRREEALREIKLAINLDPVSLIINSDAVLVYYYIGEYDLAMEQCQKVLEMDEKFWIIHAYQGLIYERKKMYQEAISEWEDVLRLNPKDRSVIASLGHIYAETGRKKDALKMIEELKKLATPNDDLSEEKVLIFAGLGQRNEAFALIENTIRKKSKLGIFFKADPRFENFRAGSRFAELMSRAGFPQ